MATDTASTATLDLDVTIDPLRVDIVRDSRHKFTLREPRIVEVEHAGQGLRLVLPADCPDYDFLLTSAAADRLFLVGRQRESQDNGYRGGAVVIARRCEDDLYVAELFHETYAAFIKGLGLESAP
jgi:hypothetical protein